MLSNVKWSTKKSTAIPPEEVRQNLSIVIAKISEGSKRTWTYRGKKEVSDNVVHVWNRMIAKNGGIYYEVNPEHPLVTAIINEHPELEKKLQALLTEIGLSLPLNSLYIDLTNDEKITNDTEQPASLVIETLRKTIDSITDSAARSSMIDSLMLVEPFCDYADEILVARKKGQLQ